MTTVQRPNRNALDEALGIYRDAMRPFLLRALRRVRGSDLLTTIRYALPKHQKDMFDRNISRINKDAAGAIDIGMFPHLVSVYWEVAFCDELGRDKTASSLIWIIKTARNEAAHPGTTDMDIGYTYSRLTDIADVLGRINAPDEKKEVEAIRNGISKRSIEQFLKYQKTPKDISDSDNDEVSSSWSHIEQKQAIKSSQNDTTDSTGQFVIYEDDPTNRARIHRVNCRFYVNRKQERLPDNRWYSGFYSLEDADAARLELGKRDSGSCKICVR